MMTFFSLVIDTFSRFWTALQHGQVLPLGNWNYLLLFVFVIIQGPLVKLLSGMISSTSYLNLYMVMMVAILASLSADVWWYSIGRSGNLRHYLRRKSTRRKKMVDLMQGAIHRHYVKVLLLGKFSVGMAIPTILAAGISQVPWRKWFPIVLLGEVIYTSILVLLGFYARESIRHANASIRLVGIVSTTIIVLFFVFYLPHIIRKIIAEDSEPTDRSIDG